MESSIYTNLLWKSTEPWGNVFTSWNWTSCNWLLSLYPSLVTLPVLPPPHLALASYQLLETLRSEQSAIFQDKLVFTLKRVLVIFSALTTMSDSSSLLPSLKKLTSTRDISPFLLALLRKLVSVLLSEDEEITDKSHDKKRMEELMERLIAEISLDRKMSLSLIR